MKKVAILGAGTMGKGIAIDFSTGGYDVNLFDSFEAARENALPAIERDLGVMAEMGVFPEEKAKESLKNITIYDNMIEAAKDADFVIEVVPEILELKQDIFAELDKNCKPDAIFASNTSSLKLGDMMAKLSDERKKRTLICHYYNPAHLLPIVELSCYGNMPEDIFWQVYDMYEAIGKKPVKVDKDVPGMVANRIQCAIYREVYSLMENEVAAPDQIEKAMMYGMCFRYATTGQREITDMGGIDVWSKVADNIWPTLESRTTSCPYMTDRVAAGEYGFKSGKGFYSYESEEEKKEIIANFQKRLMIQLVASKKYVDHKK
ncbi:MAG: 3-hydroxyacyl-CoA dehydrogenase family protein [Firmicutes bacterium]|nr:3-hydroxyacyl-CoA dehydrogenase family protein [Bacillota bacterium]